jgi:hypothetical protein
MCEVCGNMVCSEGNFYDITTGEGKPEPLYCDNCGAEICDGDTYYDFSGSAWCLDCTTADDLKEYEHRKVQK